MRSHVCPCIFLDTILVALSEILHSSETKKQSPLRRRSEIELDKNGIISIWKWIKTGSANDSGLLIYKCSFHFSSCAKMWRKALLLLISVVSISSVISQGRFDISVWLKLNFSETKI